MRRGSRRSFSGLLITIALHGVIFMTVAAAHNKPQEPVIVQREFVQAEMVKLGKKRDKFWLPKKYQPPPAAATRRDQAGRRSRTPSRRRSRRPSSRTRRRRKR